MAEGKVVPKMYMRSRDKPRDLGPSLYALHCYDQAIGNSTQNYCNSNSNSGRKSYWILQYAIIDHKKYYCNNAIFFFFLKVYTVFSLLLPWVLFKKNYFGVGTIKGKGLFKGGIIF